MKKLIYITFGTMLLSSCAEDLDVTLPGTSNKVVIEGMIENGKYAEVTLTKNIPLFSSLSGTSLSDFYITGASVYVSDGITTDTLTLGIDSASSLGITYKGHSITGVTGRSYFLTVVSDGKTYTAVTTIPAPIALDSTWWQPEPPEDSLGYAWAHLSEPAGPGNNYRWFAKRPGDRRFIAPYGATFDDKFIDGKGFDFSYSRGEDPTNPPPQSEDPQQRRESGYYKITDTIYVKFCTIDREAKDFYTTFESALGNNGNPFASPVTILTNIKGGGLGVWAGYGVTYDTIYAH
jgi:hypothetical protein